jgi:amidase
MKDGSLMTQLTDLEAHEQAELVRSGEVSALELVNATIDVIEERNGEINAVVYKRYEQAREEARSVDLSRPFAGVPTLLKASDPIAGAPNNMGCEYIAKSGRTSTSDGPMMRRFQEGGFIVLGHSSAPEFNVVSTTETKVYGITRNPWDLEHTSGGSSGGASAAVAAGMVAVAQGGDGGGSIRMPGAFCQGLALKPSVGRVPAGPSTMGTGDKWSHAVRAVVSRTVRDTAEVIDFLEDRENRNTRLPHFSRDLISALDADVPPLRIGVVATAPDHAPQVDAEISEAVWATARLMESLGHHVEESHPAAMFDPEFLKIFFDTLAVPVSVDLDLLEQEIGPANREDIDIITHLWADRGRELSGVDLTRGFAWQENFRARMEEWWTSFDILLSPVHATAAPRLGWPWSEPNGVQKSVDVLTFTAPFNTSGQPAVSVPVGTTKGGLPIGVQFAAAHSRDDLLIGLARQIEEAQPWNTIAPRYR